MALLDERVRPLLCDRDLLIPLNDSVQVLDHLISKAGQFVEEHGRLVRKGNFIAIKEFLRKSHQGHVIMHSGKQTYDLVMNCLREGAERVRLGSL